MEVNTKGRDRIDELWREKKQKRRKNFRGSGMYAPADSILVRHEEPNIGGAVGCGK